MLLIIRNEFLENVDYSYYQSTPAQSVDLALTVCAFLMYCFTSASGAQASQHVSDISDTVK